MDELTHRIPQAGPTAEARLGAIEQEQARQGGLLKEIHQALVGPTDGSKPGINARVGHLESRADDVDDQLGAQDGRLTKLERSDDRARAWALGLGVVGSGLAQLAGAALAYLTGSGAPRPPHP